MTKNKTRINNYIRTFKKMWGLKDKERDILKETLLKIVNWDSPENEIIKKEDYEMYLDEISVTAIIPKKRFLKVLIEENFEVEARDKEKTKENLEEINLSINDNIKPESTYSSELIRILFDLIKYNEIVTLRFSKDCPLLANTDDFIFIIAPRVLAEIE